MYVRVEIVTAQPRVPSPKTLSGVDENGMRNVGEFIPF